ncbi:MAG: hypothetical protein IJP43_10535 [Oscillospiraceae bacterium]|nr:hypothetical protein [Oscillospiraceae bacterium]
MTDLEFNVSPPEEVRRDEFNHAPPPKSAEKEPPRRSSAKNRALVQAVSAAMAVVVVGNSLGIDYLGDFLGLAPIVSVIESAGIAIPEEYAEYLDYLISLCSDGAEDFAISRELNGETCYNIAKYLAAMGYEDMYYSRGMLYSGQPSPLDSDHALHLGLEEESVMSLVYLEKAGGIVSTDGGEIRCVQTGVYGTAGSVTRAYSGGAHIDAEAGRLSPTYGSYTVYEGSTPEVTLLGDYVLVEDAEYASALGWYYVLPCYLENGVAALRFAPSAPSVEVKDGILDGGGTVTLEKSGSAALFSAEGRVWTSAWRGSEEASFYHTALQEAACFSYHIMGAPVEEADIAVPDKYREVFDRVFALAQSGADDDAFVAEMSTPEYKEAASWWAENLPGFWYDGASFESEPGNHPVMKLFDYEVIYLANGRDGKDGVESLNVQHFPDGYTQSFRGVMGDYGRSPIHGVYCSKGSNFENKLVGDYIVEANYDYTHKSHFLYNGTVSFNSGDFYFEGEVHNGYLKFDDSVYSAFVQEDDKRGEWWLDINPPEGLSIPARGGSLSEALMFTWFTDTGFLAPDDYAPSESTPSKPERTLTDSVKSAMDDLIAAARVLTAEGDNTNYGAFKSALDAAVKAVKGDGFAEDFQSAWYVNGELDETPSSGEAIKLYATDYNSCVTYAADASALFTGTSGIIVSDSESHIVFFAGELRVPSYYAQFGEPVSGVYSESFDWGEGMGENTRLVGDFVSDGEDIYLHEGTVISNSLNYYPLTAVDGSLQMGGAVSASFETPSWTTETQFRIDYIESEYQSWAVSTGELKGDTIEENLYHSFLQRVRGFMSYVSTSKSE